MADYEHWRNEIFSSRKEQETRLSCFCPAVGYLFFLLPVRGVCFSCGGRGGGLGAVTHTMKLQLAWLQSDTQHTLSTFTPTCRKQHKAKPPDESSWGGHRSLMVVGGDGKSTAAFLVCFCQENTLRAPTGRYVALYSAPPTWAAADTSTRTGLFTEADKKQGWDTLSYRLRRRRRTNPASPGRGRRRKRRSSFTWRWNISIFLTRIFKWSGNLHQTTM